MRLMPTLRIKPICLFCNPEAYIGEGIPHCYACVECDDDDLDEFEDERRRRMAERNEY